MADPLVGRALGELVLVERLARGGSSTVYRAHQAGLDRDAVVKVLHRRLREDVAAVERFKREAVLASRVDHPYAAHVYAFGAEPDGLLWIAMEHVRGTPLDAVLEAGGPMSLERFTPFFDRLCEVVDTAHAHGIVHRDLKPANVMVLARSGRLVPKLLDLGIAALIDEPPEGGTDRVIGSPPYLAPELWRDPASAGRASDLYALGVLAFQALTGRLPFGDAREHATAPVPPLGTPALDAVIARALAKSPADRHGSALELASALRTAAGFAIELEDMPRLPELLREACTVRAPQPIAEAVAALDAARSIDRALHAAHRVTATLARYTGNLALCARARLPPRPPPERGRALREQLAAGTLATGEWLALTGELLAPFASVAEAHPVPELATADRGPLERLAELALLPEPPDPGAARERLATALRELEHALRGHAFLADYALVVPRDGRLEAWMGLRRPDRAIVPSAGDALPDGRAVLVDPTGRAVLALAPLVEVAAPAPGAAEELFLFDGGGRHGLRRVARPVPFERHDPDAALVREVLGVAAAADVALVEDAPYRGLASFAPEDAALFFGREREAEALLNQLRVQTLIAVVGPSGAGKTSFVQAGVLPALPDGWRAVVVRPGDAPLARLEAALAGGPDVVVIDQFEELFTQCADPDERVRFAQAIAGARTRVIVTLRDDFLVAACALPPLRARLAQCLHVLATPLPPDLARIVREPLRRAGYAFDDPALPDEMVAAVAHLPGALPLLSFTCAKLWDLRDRDFGQLTRRAYAATGGVAGALAQHAEATLAAMSEPERALARQVFRHVFTADGARAHMTRRELVEILGPGGTVVIEQLIHARLLTATDAEADDGELEVIHEALLLAWPRLVAWRREDADTARLRDALRAAARQWEDRGRPRGLLWRDDALAEYRLWRARLPGALTSGEERFASAALREAARRTTVRTGILVAVVAATAVAALVLFRLQSTARARLALHYEEQGRQLVVGGDPARGLVFLREAMREGAASPALDFTVATGLRMMANQRAVLAGHRAGLWDLAWSPDGRRIATASEDGTARIWDAGDGRCMLVLEGHRAVVRSVAWSADGDRVLTASEDRTARIWDAATGAELAVLRGEGELWRASFDRGDRHVFAHGLAPVLHVWDARTFALHRVLRAPGTIEWVEPSPDGAVVAQTIGGVGTTLTDVATGERLALVPSGERTWFVAFERDGTRLATGGADGAVVVWDRTGRELARTLGHRGNVMHMQFFGGRVLSAGNDGIATLWDADRGTAIASVLGRGGTLQTASLDARGERIVTASHDGAAQVWDARTSALVASLSGHAGMLRQARFSPDAARVATAGVDGTARVWDARDPSLVAAQRAEGAVTALTARGGEVVAATAAGVVRWAAGRTAARATRPLVAIATDGTALTEDGVVVDTTTGAELARLGGAGVTAAAFGPAPWVAIARDDVVEVWDRSARERRAILRHPAAVTGLEIAGERVATAAVDGRARVWSLPTGALVAESPPGAYGALNSARFDPAGTRIVTASLDGTARIWDVARGEHAVAMTGHRGFLFGAAFSGDGARVATSGFDRTVRIWDAGSGRQLATLDAGIVTALAFDGDRLATGTVDGTLALWDLSVPALPARGLDTYLGCHVPLRLDEGRLITAPLDCRSADDDGS